MQAAGAPPTAAPATGDYEEAVARLVLALAQGDRQALPSLYKLTVQRLWALAMGLVRQPELAETLVEEVLVQVWSTASTFDRSSGSAWHWICSICQKQARALRHTPHEA